MKRIEAKAFANCPSLRTIRIPLNVLYVDPKAFDPTTAVMFEK
jgi:hypothetical protein